MSHLNTEPYFPSGIHWSWYRLLKDWGKMKKGESIRGYTQTFHTHIRVLHNDIYKTGRYDNHIVVWIPPEDIELEDTYIEPRYYCKVTATPRRSGAGGRNVCAFESNCTGSRVEAFEGSRDRDFDNSIYSCADEYDRRFD